MVSRSREGGRLEEAHEPVDEAASRPAAGLPGVGAGVHLDRRWGPDGDAAEAAEARRASRQGTGTRSPIAASSALRARADARAMPPGM